MLSTAMSGLFGNKGNKQKGGGGGKALFGAKPKPDAESDGSSSGEESESDLPKYVVKQRAIMRQGYEADSKPAKGKPLKIGELVQALETRMNDAGVLRIRVEGGWVSEKARDGTVLLAKEGESEPDSEDDSEDSESESSAAPAPAPQSAKKAPQPAKKAPQPAKKAPAKKDESESESDSESESESSGAPQPAKKVAQPAKRGPPAVPKSKNAPAPKRVTQNTAKAAVGDGAGGSKDEAAGGSDDSDESESESESASSAPQPPKTAPAKKGPPAVPQSKNAPALKRVTQNAAGASKTEAAGGDGSDNDSDESESGSESESESASSAPQPPKTAPAKKGPPAVPQSKNAPAPKRATQNSAKKNAVGAGDDGDGSDDDSEEEQDELPRYEVKNLAIVREGFEVTSKPAAAKLKVGAVVPALELRRNDKGVLRIRIAAGWVSEKAGSGQVILQEIRPLEPEAEGDGWEQLDGSELAEARSPKAAAEVIASGSQLPPPLEPLVEEGCAEWMVRATSVERAATKARIAHRSRALKVKLSLSLARSL